MPVVWSSLSIEWEIDTLVRCGDLSLSLSLSFNFGRPLLVSIIDVYFHDRGVA